MSEKTLTGGELRANILKKKRQLERGRKYAADKRAAEKPPPGTPRNKGSLHPEFVKNQWKPGQSGNPQGRPKGATLEEVLRKYLSEHLPGTDTTRLEAMAVVVFNEGITKRNAKVMKMLFDRLWPQPIKVIGDPDNPIVVTAITRKIVDAPGD